MNEISINTRNTNLAVRGLLLGGAAFSIPLLQYLPKALPLLLVAILIFLAGLFFYFRTPLKHIVLLALDGDKLNYTSSANPAIGVGKLYEDPETVLLNKIKLISIARHYIHRVGTYLNFKIYLQEGDIKSIWIGTEYEAKSLDLFKKIITDNESINIIKTDYNGLEEILFEYKDRFVDEVPDIEKYEPWRVSTSKRELFSEPEWMQLLLTPICVFFIVSKADGVVQPQEIKAFVDSLKRAGQNKSFFAEEIYSETLSSFDALFDTYTNTVNHPETELKSACRLLGDKLETSEATSFSKSLIELSEFIAYSFSNNKLNAQEEYALNKIRAIMN